MKLRPHPYVPRKIVHPEQLKPQNVLPRSPLQHKLKPAAPQSCAPSMEQRHSNIRGPQGACFNCEKPGRFAYKFPLRRPSRKTNGSSFSDQGNFCENTLAPECTGPVFWVNSSMTENPASRCQIVTVQDDLAYSLWPEQPTFCPTNRTTRWS